VWARGLREGGVARGAKLHDGEAAAIEHAQKVPGAEVHAARWPTLEVADFGRGWRLRHRVQSTGGATAAGELGRSAAQGPKLPSPQVELRAVSALAGPVQHTAALVVVEPVGDEVVHTVDPHRRSASHTVCLEWAVARGEAGTEGLRRPACHLGAARAAQRLDVGE
jgi:hypothetical protein